MKYLIKNMLRPLYYFLKNPYEREFNRLMDKYGKAKRYQKFNDVKFLNYRIDILDAPSFIWQFKEIFLEEIYKFRTDSKEPIIYDCGANIGVSILYFKSLYPSSKIKAFEADPKIVEVLKSNLIKNNIYDVEIIDRAVWIDYTNIYFVSEGADGGSIIKNNHGKDVITVRSIRLKDYLEKEEKIDLLKIDIEGAEYEVLNDCRESLKHVQNIFVEYHSLSKSPQRLSTILEILEQNKFRYYIENVTKRKHPLVMIHNKEQDFDLQLNIFGTKG